MIELLDLKGPKGFSGWLFRRRRSNGYFLNINGFFDDCWLFRWNSEEWITMTFSRRRYWVRRTIRVSFVWTKPPTLHNVYCLQGCPSLIFWCGKCSWLTEFSWEQAAAILRTALNPRVQSEAKRRATWQGKSQKLKHWQTQNKHEHFTTLRSF